MGWQDDKDIEESGVGRGPPVWALVAVGFGAFVVIGGIISTCGHQQKTSAQGSTTQSNTPANTPAYIDKVVPTPKRAVIDGLGARRVQGAADTKDTQRCAFDHGTKVMVWATAGDRAKVSSVCQTWIETRHIKMLE